MDAITIQIVSVVAIIGFLWNLHRDVADLRERMVRVEGLLEGFVARLNRNPDRITPIGGWCES